MPSATKAGRQSASIARIIRWRVFASGSRPYKAPMFSSMCGVCEVAGMAHVTAGCDTTNLRKNEDYVMSESQEKRKNYI